MSTINISGSSYASYNTSRPTSIYGSNYDEKAKNNINLLTGKEECETCKNRKYQDGSNESNVSFKSATHVSPEAAGSAVRAHEQQHVSNAYKKAAADNG